MPTAAFSDPSADDAAAPDGHPERRYLLINRSSPGDSGLVDRFRRGEQVDLQAPVTPRRCRIGAVQQAPSAEFHVDEHVACHTGEQREGLLSHALFGAHPPYVGFRLCVGIAPIAPPVPDCSDSDEWAPLQLSANSANVCPTSSTFAVVFLLCRTLRDRQIGRSVGPANRTD